ncbi:hypothetical protein K1719_003006 [Acacia pycnantha]|nr:hypothetical protein K1719_003006 [Acacia pycnantha]
MSSMNMGDIPYTEEDIIEEECSASCLQDCYCGASFYDNNRCKKQTLPLRYVTRETRDLSCFTIYFKVGLHSLESNNDNQPPHIKTTSKKAIKVIILIVLGFAVLLCSAVAISGRLIYKIGV